tara:strand:- start:14052 stop:15689 length:1638 start_codon:yes stop_codon:yes gene_type:complete
VHIIYFILFFIYFYFLGRGILIGINKLSKKNLFDDDSIFFDTSILIFYPLVGIIFFSNLMFVSNFFTSLKNPGLFLISSLFILLNLYKRVEILKNKFIYLISLLNLSILSFSSYDINFQYDAGYYHLNYQNWLREDKLIFGLNNLNGAFGTSSIVDYLAAPFWIGSNLIFLHYISIFFVVVLANFLFYHIFISSNKYFHLSSVLLLFFGFFDNFGLSGGRNGFFTIHGIIKPDIASGIIFYLSCIFLTYIYINKKYNQIEIVGLNLLIIFAYQLKISSSLLFLFFLMILINSKKFSFKTLFYTNSLLILWLVKNIFLTSCLIYPIEVTCFQLPWYNIDAIIGIANVTSDFNNSYIIGDSFISWFKAWIMIEINKTIIYNFLFSLVIVFIIKKFITKKITENKLGDFIFPICFVLGNLIIWIVGAAHPRFIYGLFAYILSMLAINYKAVEIRYSKSNFTNLIFLSIFMVTVLLIPRVNSYKTFLDDPFRNPEITPPVVEYRDLRDNWVLPKEGDQCWINLDCIPYDKNIFQSDFLIYKGFVINKPS